MGDIALAVVTFDRTPRPNYLDTTLANLARAGTFSHARFHSLHLVDSGSASDWPVEPLKRLLRSLPPLGFTGELVTVGAPAKRSAKQNCVAALRVGVASGADWVLHLEDDLDVCGDFLGSVGRWLDIHATPDRPLYPFSGDHYMIKRAMNQGGWSWEYPVEWFWGFQCFACRPAIAESLAAWLEAHPFYTHTDGRQDENAHDLEAHHWAAHHGYRFFRGSAPAFVQHIGFETSIPGNPEGGAKVTFPTWPGRAWVFPPHQ